MHNHCHTLIRFATLALLLVPGLLGQQGAFIEGTVFDPQRGAVSEAQVKLQDLDTERVFLTTSDVGGTYVFSQIPPSRYRLTAEKTGFKQFVREPIQALVGNPLTLDLHLEIGDVTETVTVTSEIADTVNTTDATRGNAIREEEIKRLPFLARNPVDLLTLQPGVVSSGITDTDSLFLGGAGARSIDLRDGVVNGIRGNQSNVTVDGIDANDWENQSPFSSVIPLTLDSVQEFRVTTTNADTSQGVSAGAQVRLITKSGSNELHGNARWYHRNTATAANSFFNNRAGVDKPKLIRNIGGGSLGGPIRRNRVFLFGDYEYRRDARESTELRTVPRESLRNGIIRYDAADGSVAELTPDVFRSLDPRGLGVNPAMANYLSQYPQPNDPGVGDGLNTAGFRFNAPVGVDAKLYTARFDAYLTSDARHALFWRGSLGDIASDQRAQQFPGQEPASSLVNNSRGFALGLTSQLSASVINNFRWGLSRQGIKNTGLQTPRIRPWYASTGNLSEYFPTVSANGRVVPVDQLSDDLSWNRGRHMIQLGGSLRFVRNNRFDFTQASPIYQMFQTDCAGFCREIADALAASSDASLQPAAPAQVSDNTVLLAGLITNVRATFLADPGQQRFLPPGSPQERDFRENGVELYFQDSWRLRANLNVTAGVRYSYYTPIWEANGAQVRPTVNISEWWNSRQSDMAAGVPADATAPLSWAPAGRANSAAPWWQPDKNNFAPRIAIAWSPSGEDGLSRLLFGGAGKSSVRAGFGVHYERVGGRIAAYTDSFGSPGVTTTLSTPTGQVDFSSASRFDGACGAGGCSGLPPVSDFITSPSSAAFPFTPPLPGRGFGFAVSDVLKNPYSMQFHLSVQREVARSTVLDVGYVGTFGRKLLLKPNMAQFYGNLQDPQSGQTFWEAQNQIAALIGANPAALETIAPIPFFENLMPNLPAFIGRPELTPTQAFYVHQAPRAPNWARTLPPLDVNLTPGNSPWSESIDPQRDGGVLFQRQFRALPVWTNFGSSNYHSFQLGLRRSAGPATFGFNYVLSKAIDNGSQPENLGSILSGMIPNAFDVGAARAVSAFDVRHNFNGHWVVNLPGRWSSPFLKTVLGGWTTTGVVRAHSGFPVPVWNGPGRATDELLGASATLLGPLQPSVTKNDPNGVPNLFSNPAAAFELVTPTAPGGVGSVFPFYGPRLFNVDLGLNKRFFLPWAEGHSLEFRATAFNAFNNVNLRESFSASLFRTAQNFGRLTSTVGPRGGAREIEFALRYEF